jgi:hypothetical protein
MVDESFSPPVKLRVVPVMFAEEPRRQIPITARDYAGIDLNHYSSDIGRNVVLCFKDPQQTGDLGSNALCK